MVKGVMPRAQNHKESFPFMKMVQQPILREINLAISDKAGCISDLLTEWEII